MSFNDITLLPKNNNDPKPSEFDTNLAEAFVKEFDGEDGNQRILHNGQNGSVATNPALEVRNKAVLEIDPLPVDILNRVDLTYSFKPLEKDGTFVTPITCLYHCEWEQLATVLEEKSEVWTGSEFGVTSWISSIRLGSYTISCGASISRALQGEGGPDATEKVVASLTGTRFTRSRSSTLGRYISSLISGGDNHISLLTAAYCALFDRLWWYLWCSSIR